MQELKDILPLTKELSLLYIDEDQYFLSTMTSELKELFSRVDDANDATIALGYAKLNNYDLIIASDVIEHLPKKEALDLLENCIKKANTMFLLNIPIGKCWLNNVIVNNNQYNNHLSFILV